MTVKFEVPGPPVGKARPRFARAGNYVRTFTPEKTVSYENLVKLMYRTQCGNRCFDKGIPLKMDVLVFHQIPKSASKKKKAAMLSGEIRPTVKPDSTNTLKSLEDGINGIAYYDDAQIVEHRIQRFYSDSPKVVVEISDIKSDMEVKNATQES